MNIADAYVRLPAKARLLMARACCAQCYAREILRQDLAWRPRRHVTRALGGEELAAARDADKRQAARVRRLRGT